MGRWLLTTVAVVLQTTMETVVLSCRRGEYGHKQATCSLTGEVRGHVYARYHVICHAVFCVLPTVVVARETILGGEACELGAVHDCLLLFRLRAAW